MMSSDLNNDHSVYPSIENSNGSAPAASSLENAKNAMYSIIEALLPPVQALIINIDASAAADTVKNHPLTQSMANGPVATNVKDQSAKTQNEFSNLAASRQRPSTTTANGQQLTHYHSFFTNLLSWENPRASAIAFAATIVSIFVFRYFNILRWALKGTIYALLITVGAELLGQTILSTPLASQFRPKRYMTLSKETIDGLLGDVHELINFFVIEAQRIFFAENIFASGLALVASFIAYHLIKFVPVWGLSLIASTVVFLTPLIYKTNKELIDQYVRDASHIVNKQTEQVKAIASDNMARATSTTKQYVGDYSNKASEMISNVRGTSPTDTKSTAARAESKIKQEMPDAPAYRSEDFPAAPKQDFAAPPVGSTVNALRDEHEPLIAT